MNLKRRLEQLEGQAKRASSVPDEGGRPAWFTAEEWAERERAFEVLDREIRAYAEAYFGAAEDRDELEKGESLWHEGT